MNDKKEQDATHAGKRKQPRARKQPNARKAQDSPAPRDLETLREAISEIDGKILTAVPLRQRLAAEVYAAKAEKRQPIYDSAQEADKLSRIEAETEAAQDASAQKAVLRTLMRVSRETQFDLACASDRARGDWPLGQVLDQAVRLERPDYKTCTVQGPIGSYSAQAAAALFPDARLIPLHSFESACRHVTEEICELAVLPLENSSAGTVGHVYELISRLRLYIVASYSLEIQHCLAGLPGTNFADIRKVLSHAQALAQCSGIIKGMDWQSEEQRSTASAAETVALRQDKSLAAIASESAARRHGLSVLSRGITNEARNQTRFVAVSREPLILPDANKLSLILRCGHQSGSLSRQLDLIADRGFNITKIQSLPVPQILWEYDFYIDILAAPDEAARRLLYQLDHEQDALRFLGWYRDGEPVPAT